MNECFQGYNFDTVIYVWFDNFSQLPNLKSITKLRGMAHGLMTAVFVTALSG